MRIEELKIGDEVVYAEGRKETYGIGIVERVTKTQLTVNGRRFSRSTGREIGDGDSWYPTRIENHTSVEEAKQRNAAEKNLIAKRKIVRAIQEASRLKLEQLSLETLQEAAKVLGLDKDNA